MSDKDQRRDERVPVSLRIKLKSADVDAFLEQYSLNLSRGGVFIQSTAPKPMGTVVRFELQLADASPVIRGEGRVVWVKDASMGVPEAEAGMGVRFTRLDGRSKALIDRAVTLKASRGIADTPSGPPEPMAGGSALRADGSTPPIAAEAVATASRASLNLDAILSQDIDPRAVLRKFRSRTPFEIDSLDAEMQAIAAFEPRRNRAAADVLPPFRPEPVLADRAPGERGEARSTEIESTERAAPRAAPVAREKARLPVDIPDDVDLDAQFDALVSGAPAAPSSPPEAQPASDEFYRGEPVVPVVDVDLDADISLADELTEADTPFEEVAAGAPSEDDVVSSAKHSSSDAELDDLFDSIQSAPESKEEPTEGTEDTLLDEELFSADDKPAEGTDATPAEKKGLFRKIFGK